MYEILAELNKTKGIIGSLVVGNDGIVIASDIGTEVDEDIIGAMAAAIVITSQKAAERMQQGQLLGAMMEATAGKMFLTDVGLGILVVITEHNVNIGLVRLEIENAAVNIKQ